MSAMLALHCPQVIPRTQPCRWQWSVTALGGVIPQASHHAPGGGGR
jgi:hypothetical protein